MEYSRDEGLRKYWDEHTAPYHKDGDGPLYKNESAYAQNRTRIPRLLKISRFLTGKAGNGKRVSSGSGIHKDAFGEIVEVIGEVDQAEVADRKGALSIVEIEIYQKANADINKTE